MNKNSIQKSLVGRYVYTTRPAHKLPAHITPYTLYPIIQHDAGRDAGEVAVTPSYTESISIIYTGFTRPNAHLNDAKWVLAHKSCKGEVK